MTGYAVRIAPQPLRAAFDLSGHRAALAAWCGPALPAWPERANTLSRRDGAALCHVGPDRWLLLADLAEETALEAALRPAEAPPEISVVRVSDTLAFFAIAGPEAAEVMSLGCPLDLDPRGFGADAVTWTEMFGLKALVLRADDGFEVAVDRSYAPMLAEYLASAVR